MKDEELFDVDVQTVISKYIDGEYTNKSGSYVPAETYI